MMNNYDLRIGGE